MNLGKSEVHIWQAQLDLVQFDANLLSPDERARADRFKFEQHRQRFVAGRAVLRSLLARYLNTDPQILEFEYGTHGKPFLKNAKIQFNLAHAEDLALYAVTCDRAVGIDVERIRAIDDLEALVHRFLQASEYEAIFKAEAEARLKLFFRYWTCKEAFLKAIGAGLSKLQELEIAIDKSVMLKKHPQSVSEWKLQEIYLQDDFVSAIAVEQADSLAFQYFNLS